MRWLQGIRRGYASRPKFALFSVLIIVNICEMHWVTYLHMSRINGWLVKWSPASQRKYLGQSYWPTIKYHYHSVIRLSWLLILPCRSDIVEVITGTVRSWWRAGCGEPCHWSGTFATFTNIWRRMTIVLQTPQIIDSTMPTWYIFMLLAAHPLRKCTISRRFWKKISDMLYVRWSLMARGF